MAEETVWAPMMTGYKFAVHPSDPTLGGLCLKTKGSPVFVTVTKQGLLKLSKALAEHADELEEVQ